MDGLWMPSGSSLARMDTEKLTINLGVVDLGKIDVLVEEGFYGNRSDFIRTAIRNHLQRHEDDMTQTVTRRSMTVGALHLERKDLEQARADRRRLTISVVGVLSIAGDVTVALADETIESVRVRGVFRAGKDVKEALADRIR